MRLPNIITCEAQDQPGRSGQTDTNTSIVLLESHTYAHLETRVFVQYPSLSRYPVEKLSSFNIPIPITVTCIDVVALPPTGARGNRSSIVSQDYTLFRSFYLNSPLGGVFS